MSVKEKKERPNLRVVEVLHPNENRSISCLNSRIHQVINEYADQQNDIGQNVTYNEIVGILEFVKKKYLNGG